MPKIKNQGRRVHFKGRQHPSNAPHRHVEVTTNPVTKTPPRSTHYATQPRTTSTPYQWQPPSHQVITVPNNPHTLLFPIPHDYQIVTFKHNILSTPHIFKTLKHGFTWHIKNKNKNKNNSTNLTTLSKATLAYKMRWFHMKCFTLDSCHCFLLNTKLFRSIQIV